MFIPASIHERVAGSRLAPFGRERRHARRRHDDHTRARFRLEGLEDRCLLSPTITEFTIPTANSFPEAITALDGNLWFTEAQTDKVGMFNPITDAFREFPVSAPAFGITAGPDGNVWFAVGGEIGEINPMTDAISEFTLPVANGFKPPVANAITAGPDGNLWFNLCYPCAVGMINPMTDAITEYPIPYAKAFFADPQGITTGPDGNLWYTDLGTNAIETINPTSHAFSQFAINSGPQGITAGPDGNVWFTAGGEIGEINPTTDAITEFPVPNGLGITAGPDGNLWFTDGGDIATINPTTDAITEFPIPYTNADPAAITTGPDGNLFFVDQGTNAIGVVNLNTTHFALTQQPPSTVTAGTPFGLTVEAKDSSGKLESSFDGTVTVALASNPGGATLGGTLTVTASGGIAAFSGLTLTTAAFGYTLQVSSSGVTTATTSAITVSPAGATLLMIHTRPSSTATAGQAFGAQPVIDVEDQYDNVETGDNTTAVTASLESGTGPLEGTTSVTVSRGVATFRNLADDKAESISLNFTSGSLTDAASTSIVISPGTASRLVIQTQPSATATAGQAFATQPVINLEDQYGNLETGDNSSVATATLESGTGPLQGTTTVTVSGGVVTFTNLALTQAGSYTLQVSGGSLPAATTSPITVTPAAPSQLVVTTTPPASVTAGVGFGVAVSAEDRYGNPTPSFSGDVTVSRGSSPLGGTTTVAASGGIAGFSGLTLDTAGTDTLQVSSTGLGSATTGAILVTPASAVQLILDSEPPGSVTAGAPFGFHVQAEDSFGNLATGFGGTVTAALSGNAGNATLGGLVTTKASGGVASFVGLTVDKVGSSFTLQVTTGTLPFATTSAFDVTAAAASRLVISAQPLGSVTAGDPFGLSLTVEDPYGNVATTFSGLITIALSNSPAHGVLNGALTAVASNGLAAFSDLSLDTAASDYAIQATSGSLSAVATGPITVAPAAADQLVVSVSPPTMVTAGADFGMTISAQDPYGNLATGFNGTVAIALAHNPGNATLNGPLTTVATGGVANIQAFLSLDTAGTGYTLEASSNGLTPVTTGAIAVIPLPATNLVVQAQPPSSVATGRSFGFVVAALDLYGNVDTNFDGQVSVAAPAGSGARLGGSTTVTASAGLVSFQGLTLSGATTPVSLPVTGTGLSGTTTNPVSLVSPAQIEFATPSVSVVENAGVATIQVVRSGGLPGAVSVNVATAGGTAVALVNYTPINQTVNFAAGQDTQSITIPVKDAGTLAQDLTVNVILSSPSSGVVLGSQSTAKLTILNVGQSSTLPAPVTMDSVQLLKNQNHQITEILIGFSGALNPSEAASTGRYSLVMAGNKGSFTAKNARVIKLKSAVYNPANDTVALTTKKRLVLTRPVQLVVDGQPPSGLEDSYGRLIAGNDGLQPGSNAVAILTGKGATISARTPEYFMVDLLRVRGELAGLTI